MANFVTGIISLAISAVIVANIYVFMVKNLTGQPNSSEGSRPYWSTTEITMWGLLSLLGIIGLLYGVLNVFGIA